MATTIPVTTVPAAITYIVGAVQAQVAQDPDADSILLALASLASVPDLPDEAISIGEVRRGTEPRTFIGSGGEFWLNETYTIDCEVWAWTGSSDSDGALTVQLEQVQRIWQLYDYVETALRLDPSLGELVDLAYPKAATQPGVSWSGDPVGVGILLPFQIYVEKLN